MGQGCDRNRSRVGERVWRWLKGDVSGSGWARMMWRVRLLSGVSRREDGEG